MAVKLTPAPLGPDGEAVLWPRAERGRRLPVTFEAVETLLVQTIEVLGLRSATGLAMSAGYSHGMGSRWVGPPPCAPSRAAIIRMIYLLALYKSDPAKWYGDRLRTIDWAHIHLYGTSFTPLKPSWGGLEVRDEVAVLSTTPLFPLRRQSTRDLRLQVETLLALTIRHLELKAMGGVARALHFTPDVCRSWLESPYRAMSVIALLKLWFLWIMHLENPRKWRGRRLLDTHWPTIHDHGLAYAPYVREDWAAEAAMLAEIRRSRSQLEEAEGGPTAGGMRFTPIVKRADRR